MTRMGEEGTTVRDQEVKRYRRRCRRLRLPLLALYVALLTADLGSLLLVTILLSGGFEARRVLLAYLIIGAVICIAFPLERGIRREWRALHNLGACWRQRWETAEPRGSQPVACSDDRGQHRCAVTRPQSPRHAARKYSWRTPPSRSRRSTGAASSGITSVGSQGRR